MTPVIRSLYAAGLFLGACVIASPATASAQGKGRGAEKGQQVERGQKVEKTQQVEKGQQKVEKAERKADQAVTKTERRVNRTPTVRRTRRTARVTRQRYLCQDGSWSYSSTCAGHDGLAARQYSPVPRASEQGILHANERSAVARAYANRVRTNAIARCKDGTYWHAGNRTNACSGHGGVARWY